MTFWKNILNQNNYIKMINKLRSPITFNNSNQIFLHKVHKNKNLTKEISKISHKEILHPAQSKDSIVLM